MYALYCMVLWRCFVLALFVTFCLHFLCVVFWVVGFVFVHVVLNSIIVLCSACFTVYLFVHWSENTNTRKYVKIRESAWKRVKIRESMRQGLLRKYTVLLKEIHFVKKIYFVKKHFVKKMHVVKEIHFGAKKCIFLTKCIF